METLLVNVLTQFLSSSAEKLVERLNSKLFQSNKSSVPALPASIENSEQYRQALLEHTSIDTKANQQLFSQKVLELLSASINVEIEHLQGLTTHNLNQQRSTEILSRLFAQGNYGLLFVAAPPSMTDGARANVFPEDLVNNRITNVLGSFIKEHYSENSSAPVLFSSNFLKTPIVDLDSHDLYDGYLGHIPTIIIYSDITQEHINIHVASWLQGSRRAAIYDFPELSIREISEQIKNEENQPSVKCEVFLEIYKVITSFLIDWYYLNVNLLHDPISFELGDEFNFKLTKKFNTCLHEIYEINLSEFWFDQGSIYFESGEYLNAANSFSEVLKLRPEWYQAAQRRGQALLRESLSEYRDVFDGINSDTQRVSERAYKQYQKGLEFTNKIESKLAREIEALIYLKEAYPQSHERMSRVLGTKVRIEILCKDIENSKEYDELGSLLADGDWALADEKTTQLMRRLAGLSMPISHFKRVDIYEISKPDLHTIDEMWTAYSGRHFSLTRQLEIYKDICACLGVSVDDGISSSSPEASKQFFDALKIFREKVGWSNRRKSGELIYSLDEAPEGHLPSVIWFECENNNAGRNRSKELHFFEYFN